MSEPLLGAVFEKDQEKARVEWTRWRETADLNALAPEELAALPLLGRRLSPWIEHDPAKPILLGICRLAWSRNQMRLRKLAELVDLLKHRGVDAVVTGSAATLLISARGEDGVADGGFLTIPWLELLLRREAIPMALDAARNAGWRTGAMDLRNASSSVTLSDGSDQCFFRWRLIANAPDLASEADALEKTQIKWLETTFSVPSPAWQLAHQLLRKENPQWKAESLLVLQREVDWDEFRRAVEWPGAPGLALYRMGELGQLMGYPFPAVPIIRIGKLASIWRDYGRWRVGNDRAGSSLSGLSYLRTRWDTRSYSQLPGLAIRMLSEFLTSRPTE